MAKKNMKPMRPQPELWNALQNFRSDLTRRTGIPVTLAETQRQFVKEWQKGRQAIEKRRKTWIAIEK